MSPYSPDKATVSIVLMRRVKNLIDGKFHSEASNLGSKPWAHYTSLNEQGLLTLAHPEFFKGWLASWHTTDPPKTFLPYTRIRMTSILYVLYLFVRFKN